MFDRIRHGTANTLSHFNLHIVLHNGSICGEGEGAEGEGAEREGEGGWGWGAMGGGGRVHDINYYKSKLTRSFFLRYFR
jgi:hypothetical protein